MKAEDFDTLWASDGDLYLACPKGPHPGEGPASGWLALPADHVSLATQLQLARGHIVAAHGGAWCMHCHQMIQQFPGLNGWRVTVDDTGPWCVQGFHEPGGE